jgi:hypothetical protein
MKEDNKTRDIQWHTPFRGAIKIELEPYMDILEYIDEKSVTKKPLQIDLLVIKKSSEVKIENAIGRIFRAFNIIEYKSPTDYLSIDDFYKVSAYAYLLKADADTEDGISFEDLTITLVSSRAPKRVFEHLKCIRGYELSKQFDGIYYLNKDMEMPLQFIVLDELSSKHTWLCALTNHITREKITNITADYDPAEKNEYKEAILDTVLKANFKYIQKFKEDNIMSNEVLELFRPEIEEAVNKKMLGIKAGIKAAIEEADKRVEESDKRAKEADKRAQKLENTIQEAVVKLRNMNITISQIAQITKLSEDKIQDILHKFA